MQSTIKLAVVASLSFLAVQGAEAQPADMMLDPGGAAPAPPAPAAPAAPPVAPVALGEDGEPINIYFGDYLSSVQRDDGWDSPAKTFNGVVPQTHTVRRGDTLWDISALYFNNAWNWPKVWGLNPEITNPHWIYPGNLVRLRDGAPEPKPTSGGEPTLAPVNSSGRTVGLRQVAYVDLEELEDAGTIDGSVDEKALLATGDSVYITYPKGKLPKVGQTYAVYSADNKKIMRGKKAAGAYVKVAAELRVTFAKEGKRARAVITRSVDAAERGMRVGPLKLNFENVVAVANDKKVDGNIVGLIGPDELIGAESAIIIDRGRSDGVKVGNRFLVIRSGDAYRQVMAPSSNVGQDDEDYPTRAIGEVIVVETSESVSMGVVTVSIHEFGVGDRVFMRKGQ